MGIDITRLAMLREIVSALAKACLNDVNLILHAANLRPIELSSWEARSGETDKSTTTNRERLISESIRDMSSGEIAELSRAVTSYFTPPSGGLVSVADRDRPLCLFASHLSTQRSLVGNVGAELRKYGIVMFVAHSDIEPDAHWHEEIERALSASDAGVAFLTPGFRDSNWCDQEVGWLLGRGIPVLPLKFEHQDPYGPLEKKQALSVSGTDLGGIVGGIIDWVKGKSALQHRLVAWAVESLGSSPSFNNTDKLWSVIREGFTLDEGQVAAVISAVRDNDQIYNAGDRASGKSYSELFLQHMVSQPGFRPNSQLAKEVAEICRVDAGLLPEINRDI